MAYTGIVGAKDDEESRANTKLIAAAPELLERLQELLFYSDNLIGSAVYDRARRAIANATGEAHV